ncbi:MAG TPA: thiamine-phosphate kinase [Actinomycetota bacterium]|nr:thiamine-phosphate kinase [Actinomycetota bacterium]
MDLTEDRLIDAVRRVLSPSDPRVVVGPGDDAAVVTSGSGEQVLTTDALVEGVHFRRELTTPRDLGYKAVAVNVSDLAAMAASPRFALCALTLTDGIEAAWVVELAGGMRECCDEFALSLVGGNLARGRDVTIVVTATGEVVPGRAVRRDGARPGHRVAVTGSLGGAAAGRRVASQRSWTDDERDALRRWMRPTPRVGEAAILAANGVAAMIDVSDGLTIDLARLCDASGTGVRLHRDRVPVHPVATRDEALGGGEDYELLAALPDGAAVERARAELIERFGVSLTEIGTIIEEGLVEVGDDGAEGPLRIEGWDHFSMDGEDGP